MKVRCKCIKCGKQWKVRRDKKREVNKIARDRKENIIVCNNHDNLVDIILGNAVFYK